MPLEFMQAIVLLEYLYHFKAKRAPSALSEMFMRVYDRVGFDTFLRLDDFY
jgi:hypothetical protein